MKVHAETRGPFCQILIKILNVYSTYDRLWLRFYHRLSRSLGKLRHHGLLLYIITSYYFIFDKIVCVLVTCYQWGHFVMHIIRNSNLISVHPWTYLSWVDFNSWIWSIFEMDLFRFIFFIIVFHPAWDVWFCWNFRIEQLFPVENVHYFTQFPPNLLNLTLKMTSARVAKRQSPTTCNFFRTTHTRTITLYELNLF